MRFHHLGIIVRDMSEGERYLESLLSTLEWSKIFKDPIQQVEVRFGLDHSGIQYELIVPTQESSPVWSTLQSRKNILNHVAYIVENLPVTAEKLRNSSHIPLGPPQPAVAFMESPIQFFLNPLGFVVELIEKTSNFSDN